jgi:hypothetical protein
MRAVLVGIKIRTNPRLMETSNGGMRLFGGWLRGLCQRSAAETQDCAKRYDI